MTDMIDMSDITMFMKHIHAMLGCYDVYDMVHAMDEYYVNFVY